MQVPIQITFRNLSVPDTIKARLHKKAEKLQQFCGNIVSCHIVVELTNKHQHQGNLHNTRIAVMVPGKELIVTHNGQEDLDISINNAFNDMTKKLEDYMKQLHRNVKNHQPILSGTIVRLFDGNDFGFIEGNDGAEFYFNATHVLHPTFQKLTVGMPVHFVEGMGGDGPQAHRVKAIENHLEK